MYFCIHPERGLRTASWVGKGPFVLRSVSGRVLDVFATPHPPSSWLIMKLGPYMKKIMRNPIPGSKTTQDVNFDDFFTNYFFNFF